MTKIRKKDASCFSFNALIRQLLMDHKPHPIEDIAAHIQTFMCKTNTIQEIAGWIRNILDQDKDLQKTKNGYILKTGASMLDQVEKLLGEADAPMAMDEIVRSIASEQNVPAEAVTLDLEKDKRYAKVEYRGKPFYFLAARKKVNDKVYEILKSKDRPMTYSEIYKILEVDYNLPRSKAIFLSREDNKIKRQAGTKFALKSQTVKKKPEQPIHNVTTGEMERIVQFLGESGNRFTAEILAESVLKRPLHKTNLTIKLAREPRVKRDDDLFFIEVEKQPVEIPQKLRETVDNSYYKVKARLVGSTTVHSIDSLLERIYKINLTHLEYHQYKEVLLEHLNQDDGVVRLLDGWIGVEAEPRVRWTPTLDLTQPLMPDPPAPAPDIDGLPPDIQELVQSEKVELNFTEDHHPRIVFRLSLAERRMGALPVPEKYRSMLPEKPCFYEVLLLDRDKTVEFRAFVHLKLNMIFDLDSLFDQYLPITGGIFQLQPVSDDPYHFVFEFSGEEIGYDLKTERLSQLVNYISQDWNAVNLATQLLKDNDSPASFRQLYHEMSAVRVVSPLNLLAILQEFKCFSSDPKKPGFYRFDPSRTGRNSLPDATPVVQAPQPEPTGVRVEPEEVREEPVPVAVAGIPVAEIKVDATQVIPVKPVSKKREKRRRAEDTELPEHLMRLKAFERKLPGLESVKSLVVKPTHGEHGRRIGAVSAGRIDTSDHPAPSRKAADADLPVLLEVPAFPKTPEDWSTASFVNPERGGGHADLNMTLEVLKVFASRTPQIRKTDGSIVLFLDSNDLAVYFRIPPENPACWIAWISETDLRGIEGGESFLHEGDMKAKNSQKGFWWSTQKFRGPRGNWKDRNVLEGVQIVAKIIDLVERKRKS